MDNSIYQCHIVDAFRLEAGRIVRDADTEFWRESLEPVTINMSSGMVQLGAGGTPVQWEILQSGGPEWDFVAVKKEPGNTVLSTIRFRSWERYPQMVMTVNGFTFATGVGEASY